MSALAASREALRTAPVPHPPAEPAEPMVRLEELGKRFGVRRPWRAALRHPIARAWRHALHEVSCEVARGELFGLLGPNGAGKSTLFRVLGTLVLPDAGRATVDGLDVVEDAPAVRRLVGVAGADERSLHWRLSAWENLRLFGALQGLRGAALKERAAEVLALVGLARGAPALVGQFSSGMRQRLLIARALLPRPRLLLLDEPTRSLDPIAARDLRQFVRRTLVEREGCTVLLATHAADEAVGLCDRVGVLHRGRLLAIGPAAQLAAGLREERWAFTTPQGRHPLWESLAGAPPRLAAGETGWTRVELALAGGLPAVAEVVRRLGEAGVAVAGVERVALPLAELLERLTAVGVDDA